MFRPEYEEYYVMTTRRTNIVCKYITNYLTINSPVVPVFGVEFVFDVCSADDGNTNVFVRKRNTQNGLRIVLKPAAVFVDSRDESPVSGIAIP